MQTRNQLGRGMIAAQEHDARTKPKAEARIVRASRPGRSLAAAQGLFIAILSLLTLAAGAFAQKSICAQVKIEVLQELTLERQAFEARMTINNGLTGVVLDNIGVDVSFADKNGDPVRATSDPNDSTAKFFIRLQTGSGVPASIPGATSARIAWLIIPARGAAGQNPQGELYSVGATLRYRAAGESNVVEVTPDTILVRPLPDLVLDYFLPNEVYGDDPFTENIVEPVVPFSLGVRVENTGYGVARKLKIESAQPRIIENKLGLLVNFHIDGSEVDGKSATPSLLADFGDIQPNRSGVARWIMTSTLSGRFVEFTANYTHADELGGQLTSLISSQPRTHLIVRDVLVDLAGRDAIRDFLARDGDVLRLYESENADTLVEDLSGNSSIAGSDERYTVSTVSSAGFRFIKLPDPLAGTEQLRSATRADGKAVPPANAWLSQTWDANGNRWDYFVNVFDVNNTAGLAYNLQFAPSGPRTNRAPRLDPINDWAIHMGNFLSFSVTAFDPDGDRLAFAMVSGPTNATLDANTGLFRWRPTRFQAPSTNVIRVTVTDNGSPAMSDTTNFTVIVLAVQRFELVLGSTNIFAGESNAVPVVLKSDVALTNVTFLLMAPGTNLANFGLHSMAELVLTNRIEPLGSNQYAISFAVDPLRVQYSTRILAMLGFESQLVQTSSIVPLKVEEAAGQREAGTEVVNSVSRDGFVVVFAGQPLLLGSRDPGCRVTLYGRPGATYAIETKNNLATTGSWSNLVWIPLSNRWQTFAIAATNPAGFYRACEFEADPPVLAWHARDGSVSSLLLYGKRAAVYRVESATDLDPPVEWAPLIELLPAPTNSWRLLSVTNTGEPARFFRARNRKD